VADAEKNLEDASAAVKECNDDIDAIQDEIVSRQHKRDMFKRIFDIATSGDGEEGDVSEKTSQASLTVEQDDGDKSLASVVSAVLSPTVAHAATTNATVMPEGFPTAESIIDDPSVLDPFIGDATDDDIRELLSDIQGDAMRIADLSDEIEKKAKKQNDLKGKMESLSERIPELDQSVSKAQEQVEASRNAYAEISPQGIIGAPDGYRDTRRNGSANDGSSSDKTLVFMWVDMFILMVGVVIAIVMIEDKVERGRAERQQGRG
jgi:hypothetical protein